MTSMVTTGTLVHAGTDRRSVHRYLGYGWDGEPPARISSLIDEYVDKAQYLIEPSFSYVIRDVLFVQGSRVFVDGPAVFESEIVASLLGRCHSVAVLAVTIGGRLEEMCRGLARDGLMLQASVLDAIGSAAVEGLADMVQRAIAYKVGARGYVTSGRFSPGYCDWDISQQLMVFRVTERDATEIRLTEDCLMIPRKSLAGIIGIGRADSGVGDFDPCRTCDRQGCEWRR